MSEDKRTRLEKLADLAERNQLKQKPSKILGEDAPEFIKVFAKRHPSNALFAGVRLKDDAMAREAVFQLFEQCKKCERWLSNIGSDALFEMYKFQRENNILDNNQEYELRKMVVEEIPKEVYLLDLEKADEECDDHVEAWRRNQELRESRAFFALEEPFEAWNVARESRTVRTGNCTRTEKDEDLEALAKSHMVIAALGEPGLFENIGNIIEGYRDYELGMMTAKATLELIDRDEEIKSRHGNCESKVGCGLEEREIRLVARAAYWGAIVNHDLRLQNKAREAYVKYDLKRASLTALDERWRDEKLGRIVVEEILDKNKEGETYRLDGQKRMQRAHRICNKYALVEFQERIREKLVSYSPELALNYGLESKDRALVELASEKLGEKVDDAAIELFQKDSGAVED